MIEFALEQSPYNFEAKQEKWSETSTQETQGNPTHTGFEVIIEELQQRFGPLNQSRAIEVVENFLSFKRKKGDSVDLTVAKFEESYRKARQEGGLTLNAVGLSYIISQILNLSAEELLVLLNDFRGGPPQDEPEYRRFTELLRRHQGRQETAREGRGPLNFSGDHRPQRPNYPTWSDNLGEEDWTAFAEEGLEDEEWAWYGDTLVGTRARVRRVLGRSHRRRGTLGGRPSRRSTRRGRVWSLTRCAKELEKIQRKEQGQRQIFFFILWCRFFLGRWKCQRQGQTWKRQRQGLSRMEGLPTRKPKRVRWQAVEVQHLRLYPASSGAMPKSHSNAQTKQLRREALWPGLSHSHGWSVLPQMPQENWCRQQAAKASYPIRVPFQTFVGERGWTEWRRKAQRSRPDLPQAILSMESAGVRHKSSKQQRYGFECPYATSMESMGRCQSPSQQKFSTNLLCLHSSDSILWWDTELPSTTRPGRWPSRPKVEKMSTSTSCKLTVDTWWCRFLHQTAMSTRAPPSTTLSLISRSNPMSEGQAPGSWRNPRPGKPMRTTGFETVGRLTAMAFWPATTTLLEPNSAILSWSWARNSQKKPWQERGLFARSSTTVTNNYTTPRLEDSVGTTTEDRTALDRNNRLRNQERVRQDDREPDPEQLWAGQPGHRRQP